jgi:hypothetical protein
VQITRFFHAAKPGSMRTDESTSKLLTDQVLLNDDLTFGPLFKMEDPDLHYIYVCIKVCIALIFSFFSWFWYGCSKHGPIGWSTEFSCSSFSFWFILRETYDCCCQFLFPKFSLHSFSTISWLHMVEHCK